jgi:uncharacterized membrane protein YhaH (DUF805 family)
MTLQESIRTCFAKYADFSGNASRSEYWWFFGFVVVVSVLLSKVSVIAGLVFSLATLLPSLSAGTRRLHDTGRSGWWQLVCIVPLIGLVVIVLLLVQESRPARA